MAPKEGHLASPDVIIVGTGLAGAATAWHLSKDYRVLLLEKADAPGQEASAQNAGMIRRLGEDPCERSLAFRTFDFLDNPPSTFPSGTSRKTGAVIGLARDPHHLTDAAAHLLAAGIPIEPCDRPASLAPCMAGSPISTAWHMPDERVVNPALLLEGFLQGAQNNQATIQTRCRVERILVEKGRVKGVKTSQGRIYSGSMVLAAGAWSASLAGTAGLKRPLIALRRGIFQSTAHPLSTIEHPWCWIDDVGVYVRPQEGKWLFSPCDEIPETPPPLKGSRGTTHPRHLSLVLGKLQRYLPTLRDLRVERGWTGLRTFAPDRRPLLGKDPAIEGLWWAAGLGGFGVTCSYGVGEAIARWMQNRSTPWINPASVCPGRAQASRFLVRSQGDLHQGKLTHTHI